MLAAKLRLGFLEDLDESARELGLPVRQLGTGRSLMQIVGPGRSGRLYGFELGRQVGGGVGVEVDGAWHILFSQRRQVGNQDLLADGLALGRAQTQPFEFGWAEYTHRLAYQPIDVC